MGRKGDAKRQDILDTAKAMLLKGGVEAFVLRDVAERLGITHGNLQYYFPTREALIRALMEDVQAEYLVRYAEKFASLPPDPPLRFLAMLDYLIEDIHSAETRRFFVQLWALLDSSEPDARLLNEMFEHGDRITGYTTGGGFFGHAVGESTEELKALIGAAPTFLGIGFLLPTRNGDLLRWCLQHGLRVVQPMTLMSIGLYNTPMGAFLPSIIY